MRHERNALNRQLAVLLGWDNIEITHDKLAGTPPWWTGTDSGRVGVPDWEADWSICAPLMVKYGCYPYSSGAPGTAARVVAIDYSSLGDGAVRQLFICPDVYANMDTAVRAAVIQAVIAQLESNQG